MKVSRETIVIAAWGKFFESNFVRFCAVGAIGFSVDASVLSVLTEGFGSGAVRSRLVSFSVAVIVTYGLNRHWAFRERSCEGVLVPFLRYLGVQAVGFLCNMLVYTALVVLLPKPFNAPVGCLIIASAFAMFVNYSGARRIVFVRTPSGFSDAAGDGRRDT